MGILSNAAAKVESAAAAVATKIESVFTPTVNSDLSADVEALISLAIADLAAGESPAQVIAAVIVQAKADATAEFSKATGVTLPAPSTTTATANAKPVAPVAPTAYTTALAKSKASKSSKSKPTEASVATSTPATPAAAPSTTAPAEPSPVATATKAS